VGPVNWGIISDSGPDVTVLEMLGSARKPSKAVGVRNALVVSQDGSNGESRKVVVESNDSLVGRVLFGLLHIVEVGVEDVVSLAQVVAGETTPQLGALDSL
jgi:hypothetical protein